MSRSLKNDMLRSIIMGLGRKSITCPSKWAEAYRIMGRPYSGKWTFKHHPWLREMHDCLASLMVGMKAAQMGYTEVGLNKTFYHIDILGVSVLYILPAKSPDASDFSSSRFDPALELSEHLASIFSDVKNIGHKRAGTANLYIRGSRSRAQLKSVPAGFIVIDEVDECVQENIPMVFERMSGQIEKQAFLLSTPTIESTGIHSYFVNSTQKEFFFRCPHCNQHINLQFPRNIIITAEEITDPSLNETYLICHECNGRLEHTDKPDFLKDGKWVSKFAGRDSEGYHINQLYSCTVQPAELARLFLSAQTNPADEQEFFNSKLGLCHVVEGAQVTDDDIAACVRSYKMAQKSNQDKLVTMGVDVGKWLHYEITEWTFINAETYDINANTVGKVLSAGKCVDFETLDTLIVDHAINMLVIDANPERRKALELAQRHYGMVYLCFYANGISSKVIQVHPEEQHSLSVDRTTWLDLSLGRFHNKTIQLPSNIPTEYKNQLKAPVRIYERDSYGNPVGRYVNGSRDDHYAHARNYCEIALTLAASQGSGSSDIIERVL